MKRGSVLDGIAVGILIIAVILLLFVWQGVVSVTTPVCNSVATSIGASANATAQCAFPQQAVTNFGATVPFILLVIGLVSVALAAIIPVPPYWLPLGIIFILVGTIVFYQVQTSVPDFLGGSFFAPSIAAYPLAYSLLENIALIVFVVSLLIAAVTYGRWSRGGTPEG